MARTWRLVKGDPASPTASINVINTGATGWIFQRGRAGQAAFPINLDEGDKIVESYSLRLKEADHDSAASTIQSFIKMLRDAWLYHITNWQKEPVFIEQQTTGETGARYALVYAAPELEWPDLFNLPFEASTEIESLELALIRAHPWESAAPGQLDTVVTLTASDGPTSRAMVHVANFRDDGNLTHVFHYDSSLTSFSANLLAAADGTALWPAAPAAGDILYFGSTDIAWKHACLAIGTAGDFNWTIVAEAYISGAWTAITLGTDFTVFRENGGELTTIDDLFKNIGLWSINVFPNANWQTVAINGQTAYWMRFRLTAMTSTVTLPTKNGDAMYAQRSPYVEIPTAALAGDSPARLNIRMWAPSGGATSPGPSNLSRILFGAKSRGLTNFTPLLNLGNQDNPAAWTTAYGTDASATSDTQAPGGAHCAVSFATDTNLVARVTITGDDILDDFEGDYRLFVRAQQIGGAAGDVKVRLRAYIGSQNDKRASFDTPSVKTNGADDGPEWLDLGLLRLPLGRTLLADDLDTTDLILQILAQRTTGTSTLRLYDIYLMPVDEWAAAVDDFGADVTNGNTSLKGGDVLDFDGGLISVRAQRYYYDGTDLVPTDIWAPIGPPPELKKLGADTRLYFLMLHYASGGTWGSEPLTSRPGCHLAVEIYMHKRYTVLRGAA